MNRALGRSGPVALAWAVLLGPGCGDNAPPAQPKEEVRPKRVFAPPPGEVRAVPPFAIRSDGVGPYVLGSQLEDVLDQVPRGPRIELLKIDGVADFSLVRSEGDALLIGSVRSEVAFVSVLGPDIATTATGIGIGSPETELAEALAQKLESRFWHAADPRLRSFSALPGVRFLIEDGLVAAATVAAAGDAPKGRNPMVKTACRQGGPLADDAAAAEIVEVVQKRDGPATVVGFGCFASSNPEALVVAANKVVVVGGEPGKMRRITSTRASGLVFASPIDVDGDGRDELVLVKRIERQPKERRVVIELVQWEAGRSAPLGGMEAYLLRESDPAWSGPPLDEIELLLEIKAHDQKLYVGGLYVHQVKGKLREVTPLIELSVPLHKRAPEEGR
jgi:hypothetical protein